MGPDDELYVALGIPLIYPTFPIETRGRTPWHASCVQVIRPTSLFFRNATSAAPRDKSHTMSVHRASGPVRNTRGQLGNDKICIGVSACGRSSLDIGRSSLAAMKLVSPNHGELK